MPAWLPPRVRLGVTASLVVLIACTLLVAPHLFHDGAAGAPSSLTTESASIDLPLASPPSSPVLPNQISGPAVETPAPFSLPPSRNPSSAPRSDSHATAAEPNVPPAGASAAVINWAGQNSLATQGIAWPLSDCLDCISTPGQVATFSANGARFAGGGGGFASGAGSGAPGLADTSNPTTPGSGPSDQVLAPPGGGSNPGGPNLPTTPPNRPVTLTGPEGSDDGDPGDPIGPDPQQPPMVQVPEPASLVMAGAGALTLMIRARLARKRRG
ncbi:MAG TPA: PEP-CTERM sorting domain-containing protein [Vicinamibacterales bacterium]|nr:PEP-CTERM sorting domain-containing protein [Vicinamibacterales bacterium]